MTEAIQQTRVQPTRQQYALGDELAHEQRNGGTHMKQFAQLLNSYPGEARAVRNQYGQMGFPEIVVEMRMQEKNARAQTHLQPNALEPRNPHHTQDSTHAHTQPLRIIRNYTLTHAFGSERWESSDLAQEAMATHGTP
jgi:hypothetical protein